MTLEMGALDAASGVTCAATSLPTGLPKIVTAAGEYTPAGPVGASLAFSDAVETVVSQIDDARNNGAVVAAAYQDSGIKAGVRPTYSPRTPSGPPQRVCR